jgi:hypothetical protein
MRDDPVPTNQREYALKHKSSRHHAAPLLPGWLVRSHPATLTMRRATVLDLFGPDVLHCKLRSSERVFVDTISCYNEKAEQSARLMARLEGMGINIANVPMRKMSSASAADVSKPCFLGRHANLLVDKELGKQLVVEFTPVDEQPAALAAWDALHDFFELVDVGPDVDDTPTNREFYAKLVSTAGQKVVSTGVACCSPDAFMCPIVHMIAEHFADAVRANGPNLHQFSCEGTEGGNCARKKTTMRMCNKHTSLRGILPQVLGHEIVQKQNELLQPGILHERKRHAASAARDREKVRVPLGDITDRGLALKPESTE